MRQSWSWRLVAPILIVLLLSPVHGTAADTATGTMRAGNGLIETFDSARWYEHWGLSEPPWHTTRVQGADDHLRISFAAGSFNGTSWSLPTGAADSVTLRYRIRFGATWQPMVLQTGKLPGFGIPRYNAAGRCAEACGLEPVVGPHYSARASFDQLNRGGSYVYTPPCGDTKRLTGANQTWDATPFMRTVWYEVTQRIDMNTPGVADGRIQAWIDGKRVFDSGPSFCFRAAEHPGVHVGNAWMEFYFGGRLAPLLPTWIDLDDVSVSW